MKISVIIPVYNVENYLRVCLQSLVEQTLKDMEVLIVNDGSTDSSQEIINEFVENYPTLFKAYEQSNSGQAAARNVALAKAQGDFIGFVDSDDWVLPTMYEEMVKVAEEKNADIVICDTTDHFISHTVCHTPTKEKNVFNQTPSACNKIFRRTLTDGFEFLRGCWYEDFNFTTKMLFRTNNIERISKDFYHCHCREVSTMFNDNAEKNLDMITVIKDMIDYFKKEGFYEEQYEDICFILLHNIVITTINRIAIMNNIKKKEVIQRILQYCKSEFPDILESDAYQTLPRNRRIVAWLNWHGYYKMSQCLLKLKKKIK